MTEKESLHGPVCGLHDTLTRDIAEIKQTVKEGFLNLQESMVRVFDAQATRRVKCAEQDGRLARLESDIIKERGDREKAVLEEKTAREKADQVLTTEADQQWTRINNLSRLVYIGVGGVAVFSMVANLLTIIMLFQRIGGAG